MSEADKLSTKNTRKTDRKFLERVEEVWLDEYEDPEGINILPDDLMAFLTEFADTVSLNDHPDFHYDELHCSIRSSRLSKEQTAAIWELGRWAGEADTYGEVEPEMFGWGYNLYSSIILSSKKLYVLPFNTFEEIMLHSFVRPTVRESIEELAGEAEANVPLLWSAADDLLDGLVDIHNEFGYIEDDPDQEFENGEIRAARLAVMRAGIGLAYRHCLQFVQGYAQ